MEQLSDRKHTLFGAIVEDYVSTAKPIGSKMIVDKHNFDVSSATIRNEMKELEEMGLITHPHTSAGRIPTALGYQYYVDHIMNSTHALPTQQSSAISKVLEQAEAEELALKGIAKMLAAFSNEAVLLRLGDHSFYYTGISNIFRKPEFSDVEMIYAISDLVDHLDEVLSDIEVNKLSVMIGDDNPISPQCSTVITSYVHENIEGVMAILGPMRMQYQHNYAMLNYVESVLNNE